MSVYGRSPPFNVTGLKGWVARPMRGGRVAVRRTQRQRFRVRPTRSMGLRLATFVVFPGKMCFAVLPSSLPLSGEPVTHVIVCGAAHQESVWVQEPRTHNQPERFAASCHLARERRDATRRSGLMQLSFALAPYYTLDMKECDLQLNNWFGSNLIWAVFVFALQHKALVLVLCKMHSKSLCVWISLYWRTSNDNVHPLILEIYILNAAWHN